MITPEVIREKAEKYWENEEFLSALLHADNADQALFPLEISFKKPTSKQLIENFVELKKSVHRLREGSKENLTLGYLVEYKTLNHRQLGAQRIPQRIIIESQTDYLALTAKQQQFTALKASVEHIKQRLPQLRSWVIHNPKKILVHLAVMQSLLDVADWFLQRPTPNCYLRELDIPNVDTKFIEQNKVILRELLDELLPSAAINQQCKTLSGFGFERRYGLRYDEALIRFRVLGDLSKAALPYSDMSIPLSQFIEMPICCSTVFITENKINGLSFPAIEDSIVIFGLGYGINALQKANWLQERSLVYWGDIDTHGLAILSQLRQQFPHVQSLMMDSKTFLKFENLWVQEPEHTRYLGELTHLSIAEAELFSAIKHNQYGRNIRLEQERINYYYVRESLEQWQLNEMEKSMTKICK